MKVDVTFVWVMDYPGRPGFYPEIVDMDGKTIEVLPKQITHTGAVKSLQQWARDNNKVTIHMPSGKKL